MALITWLGNMFWGNGLALFSIIIAVSISVINFELIKEFENVSLEDNEVFSQKNNQKAIIDLLEDYDFKKSKYEL